MEVSLDCPNLSLLHFLIACFTSGVFSQLWSHYPLSRRSSNKRGIGTAALIGGRRLLTFLTQIWL